MGAALLSDPDKIEAVSTSAPCVRSLKYINILRELKKKFVVVVFNFVFVLLTHLT